MSSLKCIREKESKLWKGAWFKGPRGEILLFISMGQVPAASSIVTSLFSSFRNSHPFSLFPFEFQMNSRKIYGLVYSVVLISCINLNFAHEKLWKRLIFTDIFQLLAYFFLAYTVIFPLSYIIKLREKANLHQYLYLLI